MVRIEGDRELPPAPEVKAIERDMAWRRATKTVVYVVFVRFDES